MVRALAAELADRSVVLTFDRHPATVVRPESAPPILTDEGQRLELLAATGIDAAVMLPFDTAPGERAARVVHRAGARRARSGQGHRGRPRLPLRSQPQRPRRHAREVRPHPRLRGPPDRPGRSAPTESTSPSARRPSAGRWPAATSPGRRRCSAVPYEIRGMVVMGDQRGRSSASRPPTSPCPDRSACPPTGCTPDGSSAPTARCTPARSTSAGARRSTSTPTPRCSRPTCSTSPTISTARRLEGPLHPLPAQRAQVRRHRGDRRPTRRRRRPRPRAAAAIAVLRPDRARRPAQVEGGVEHGDELVGGHRVGAELEVRAVGAQCWRRRCVRFTQSPNATTSTSASLGCDLADDRVEPVHPLGSAAVEQVDTEPGGADASGSCTDTHPQTRDTPAADQPLDRIEEASRARHRRTPGRRSCAGGRRLGAAG